MTHLNPPSRTCRFPGPLPFVLVLVTCLAGGAFGGVYISPPEPTEQDSISIEVRHGFGDGCWSITHHVCSSVAGDSIAIDVYALDVHQYGWTCTAEVWSYGYTCDYGRLPLGLYTVVFTEHHDSLRWPEPRIEIVDFEVRPETPAEATSWGRIRALYR